MSDTTKAGYKLSTGTIVPFQKPNLAKLTTDEFKEFREAYSKIIDEFEIRDRLHSFGNDLNNMSMRLDTVIFNQESFMEEFGNKKDCLEEKEIIEISRTVAREEIEKTPQKVFDGVTTKAKKVGYVLAAFLLFIQLLVLLNIIELKQEVNGVNEVSNNIGN